MTGGLLHLVQRGGAWAGCGPAQTSPRCTKCNSPPINGQCTNFILFDVHSKWLTRLVLIDRLADAQYSCVGLYKISVSCADECLPAARCVDVARYIDQRRRTRTRHPLSAVATTSPRQLLAPTHLLVDTSFANNVINYSFARFRDDDNRPSLADRRAVLSIRQLRERETKPTTGGL